MHADPYLRALSQTNQPAAATIAARRTPIMSAPDSTATEHDRPVLASVSALPTGTPLAELCPTAQLRCPTRDGSRLSLHKLLADLDWTSDIRRELVVVAAADHPVLWLHGAAPPVPASVCTCEGCDHDQPSPTERLLAVGHELAEPASLDAKGRLRLTDGHLAAIGANVDAPVAAVGLADLDLIAIGSAADLVLHGALSDVRIPKAVPTQRNHA